MKLQTETITLIQVQDWDKLVMSTYRKPYSFQQQDGCKERQLVPLTVPDVAYDYKAEVIPETVNHPIMGVSFKAWLARDPKQKLNAEKWKSPSAINMWWERNFYPDVQMIANDLYQRGLLDVGEYHINIDW